MMRHILLFLTALCCCHCVPVTRQNIQDDKASDILNAHTGLEYDAYLKEVVQVLENDEEFKKKLENAPLDHIRSGQIAEELDFVHHSVRDRLDELKRQEITRLRELAIQYHNTQNGINKRPLDPSFADHLNHVSPDKFEIKDLQKLIEKASHDLEKVDAARHKEFKKHEMRKEHGRREKMKGLDEDEKKKAEKEHQEEVAKHKDHPKMHHPGNREQLQEVWEETDQLDPSDFNPKTFFKLHDINGDGVWDPAELEALFTKELDKVYDANNKEDDMEERKEEMLRMREHVMKEMDTNGDGLVSWAEFEAMSKKQEFNQDPEWETLDENEQFTDDELKDYEEQMKKNEEMMRRNGYGQYGEGRGFTIPPGEGQQQQQQGGNEHVQQQQQGGNEHVQQQQMRFAQRIQEMDQQFQQHINTNYRHLSPSQKQRMIEEQRQRNILELRQYQQGQQPPPQFQQRQGQQFQQPPQQFQQQQGQQFQQPPQQFQQQHPNAARQQQPHGGRQQQQELHWQQQQQQQQPSPEQLRQQHDLLQQQGQQPFQQPPQQFQQQQKQPQQQEQMQQQQAQQQRKEQPQQQQQQQQPQQQKQAPPPQQQQQPPQQQQQQQQQQERQQQQQQRQQQQQQQPPQQERQPPERQQQQQQLHQQQQEQQFQEHRNF